MHGIEELREAWFNTPDPTIRKKIGRAVTDVGPTTGEMGPDVKNLFTLLEVYSPPDRLAQISSCLITIYLLLNSAISNVFCKKE